MINEHSAIGVGRGLPISDKHTSEILRMIKGNDIDKALKMLDQVMNFKKAVPFKRKNSNVAHKPGMAAGRYPIKACSYIINVLKNAKANAINKGLQEDKLFIKSAVTGLGISKSRMVRSRKGGYTHSAKSTHVFITIEEREEKPSKRTKPQKGLKKIEKKEVKAK